MTLSTKFATLPIGSEIAFIDSVSNRVVTKHLKFSLCLKHIKIHDYSFGIGVIVDNSILPCGIKPAPKENFISFFPKDLISICFETTI